MPGRLPEAANPRGPNQSLIRDGDSSTARLRARAALFRHIAEILHDPKIITVVLDCADACEKQAGGQSRVGFSGHKNDYLSAVPQSAQRKLASAKANIEAMKCRRRERYLRVATLAATLLLGMITDVRLSLASSALMQGRDSPALAHESSAAPCDGDSRVQKMCADPRCE